MRSFSIRTVTPALLALAVYGLAWHCNDQILSLLALSSLVLIFWVSQVGIHRWTAAERYAQGWLPKIMALWFLWFMISVFWSSAPYTSWLNAWILGSFPLIFLAWTWHTESWKEIDQDKAWAWVRRGVFGTVLILAGWAAYQYVYWKHMGMSPAGLRPYGPLLDTNSFAAWMNLLFFPGLMVWMGRLETYDLQKDPRVRWEARAWLGLLALILLAGFSTDSRGGLLSWLCTWPWVLWLYWKKPKAGRRLALVGAVALLAFSLFQWSRNFDLIGHLSPSFISSNISTVSRWLMWKATWTMYLQHPWLGSGLGTYFLWYPHFRLAGEIGSAGTYAHNDYLQFLMEGGPINLAFLLALAGGLAVTLFRLVRKLRPLVGTGDSRKTEAFGLVLGVWAITGHALGNFIFYNLPLGVLAGLFLARAWQVFGPGPVVLIKPQAQWQTGAKMVTGIVAGFELSFRLLLLLASVTLASQYWVGIYLPKVWQVRALLGSNQLLRMLNPVNPGPFELQAQLDTTRAKWYKVSNPGKTRQLVENAFVQYKHALYGIPEDPPIYYDMGLLVVDYGHLLGLTEVQQDQQVTGFWKTAIYFNPSNLQYRWELANWEAHHGRPKEGLSTLARAYLHPILGRENRGMLKAMLAQYQKTWKVPVSALKP